MQLSSYHPLHLYMPVLAIASESILHVQVSLTKYLSMQLWRATTLLSLTIITSRISDHDWACGVVDQTCHWLPTSWECTENMLHP